MIQELLGGKAPAGVLAGDRKMSIPSTTTILTALSTPTPSTTTTTTLVSPTNPSSGPKNNSEANLRCPRCESTNTKFCYYNNYNLTQPRHFCKTCRRYWTKGGTLRNVPIGGGCRKNRSSITTSSSPASASNSMAKPKSTLSTEMLVNAVNPGFLENGFLDHLQGPSPTPWPNSVLPHGQSSHILALLRGASQFPSLNPSPSPSPSPFISSPFSPHKTDGSTNNGLDPYGNGAPSLHGSFMRSNQYQLNGSGLRGPDINVPNGGYGSNILELYQRFKSSPDYCGNENPRAVILGNVVGSSSSSVMNSTVLEATPVGGAGDHNLGGGYGIMTSAISNWTEFPTVPY